jgi:aminopeptidase N
MRRPVVATAVALGLTVPLLATTAASAAPGSTTSGDPYFPQAGNGGYDVQHYGLGLDYAPSTGRLDGKAVITLTATTDLDSFSLDLRGLTASSVQVDHRAAAFTQLPPPPDGRGGELVVTPEHQLRAGSRHVVTVVYGGVPGRPTDIGGDLYGFVTTPDGAFVANEPEGASTWFPVNDVPTDKATYDFVISVPQGLTAVANGELVGKPLTSWGRTFYVWRATDPMASYLATASIGNYTLSTQQGPHGLPITNYVDADLGPEADDALALQPQMIEFFEGVYGRYPFTSAGAIVDDDTDPGYALETQTKPIYAGAPDEATVAHELAHQWVGDSVTPETWRDIWLNEGFATYSEWLWTASRGGAGVQDRFDEVMATPTDDPFWATPPGDPGAADLFAAATYDRGAAALHALRGEIGDQAFARLLKEWTTRNAGGNVSTADLVALAEEISGQQLDAFFQTWIYTPGKPTSW